MKVLNWHNCYSGSLKGIVSDASFAHPAKFSYNLICRIYEHGFEQGYWKAGDLIADPFAGCSVGGIVAAANGLYWIGVELEQKFVQLSQDNFSLHGKQWALMGKPRPVILQGDSREFASLIQEAASSVITSPPYSESEIAKGDARQASISDRKLRRADKEWHGYGTTKGQIGAMKEGKLDEVVSSVITSPPWQQTGVSDHEGQTDALKGGKFRGGGDAFLDADYGQSEGQLGGMPEGDHGEVVSAICTSPPYANSMSSEKSGVDWSKCKREDGRARDMSQEPAHATRIGAGGEMRYSPNSANMGNLPEGSHEAVVDAICTSPPYEGTHIGLPEEQALASQGRGREIGSRNYATDSNNIGNQKGSTYWQAVSEVYQECYKALKPNGCMAVVVKSFVRNKKIVDLPSQTLELLVALGFEPLERIRAWMTSKATQKSLMPELVGDYTKARMSFFRRLHVRKYPHLAINFEEVLIVRKPA